MYTDPIADMLTRIRNASVAKKTELVLPYSRLKENLANVLAREGFIGSVKLVEDGHKTLQISLRYTPTGDSVITGLRRVSKPGQRMYVPVEKIPRSQGGFGVAVLSTSKGLLTDREARKAKIGGEILCEVW